MIDLGFVFDPAEVQSVYTTHNEPRLAFTDLLLEHGFHGISEIIPDWSLQRIKDAQDKPTSKARSGWYLYSEFSEEKTGATIGLGVFGSWHGQPEKVIWCSKKTGQMTQIEHRAYLERVELARQNREEALKERQFAASIEVTKLFGDAIQSAPQHGYCTRKGISPDCREARVVPGDADQYQGWLIVPVVDCDSPDKYSSAQYISASGDKFFHTGGKIKGCFSLLSGYNAGFETVYIVEGFATGQTVRDATGCSVYVAFNAGNLADVASYVRSVYPLANIVIAGDNDHESKVGNTGKHSAESAALLCSGGVLLPEAHEGDTDWNDYSKRYGIAKTRDALAYIVAEKPITEKTKNDTALAGLVRMTLDWISLNSFYQQPELSLLNVIAALGAVCGRRYKLEDYGTRTNIYTLGIAPTGMGKDNSRQRIKELLRLSGLSEFVGSDEIRSGPGLLDHIVQKPSMVYQIDEFGMFLKSMASANTAGYAQTIPAILTKLYSSSGSSYETGNLKGDEGLPPSIQEPCLSIYGTTTEGVYEEAMKASAIASGELNRYVIGQAAVSFPPINKSMKRVPPTDALLRAWAAFKPVVGKEIIVVNLGDQRENLLALRDYQREKQIGLHKEGLDGVYARFFENTMKVAMILAIARNYKEPVIEADIVAFASTMIEESLEFVLKFARNNMFENEDQRKCNKVVDLLRKNGGEMTRRDVMRVLRLSSKDMTAIEDTLGFDNGSGAIQFDRTARPMLYRLLR